MRLVLRLGGDPALYYSDHNPAEGRLIGYVRFDFSRGNEFWHTWWPGKAEAVGNTPAFERELASIVNELKEGILKSVASARQDIACLAIPPINEERKHYGFHIETQYRSYYVRVFPYAGDYSYIYCYFREDAPGQILKTAPEKSVSNEVV